MKEIKLLALHIYPLDNDEECDKIIEILKKDIGDVWTIEKPTSETNAIFMPIKSKRDDQKKLLDTTKLLKHLNKKTIDSIKNYDLSISLRIHYNGLYLSLPDFLIKECGRLGIEINILNEKLMRVQT